MPDASCEVHKSHKPQPLALVERLIVPLQWQTYWQPTTLNKLTEPWSPLVRYDGLFDERTVRVCPTGAMNIDYWAVALLRAVPRSETIAPAVESVKKAARNQGITPDKGEFDLAEQALIRWKDAGGSLIAVARAFVK